MKKVLLGMSGGVDSSTSAILLQKQGYEVIGCTMMLVDKGDINNDLNVIDAKKVCDKLGIKHYAFDFREKFEEYVINNFIDTYNKGKTPNPCVICNKYVKFKMLYDKAKELGIEYIATGHYAKVEFSNKYNQNILRKSKSIKKDQSYFLYNIDKEILDYIVLPLSEFETKDEIRQLAKEEGLQVYSKPDSEDICFIPNGDYISFLKSKNVKFTNGNFIDLNGKTIYKHEGIQKYTIGQRRGLELPVTFSTPRYVVRFKNNDIILGEEKDIYLKELIASDINMLVDFKFEDSFECYAKIRYATKEAKAKVYKQDDNKYKVVFEDNQRAVTKGQAIVFYTEDGIVLGGGTITDC